MTMVMAMATVLRCEADVGAMPISLPQRVVRISLVVGLVVLAWQTVAFGMGVVLRRQAPVLAARFAPGNALVLGRLAQFELKASFPAALGSATRALRRDPTSASAAGALSMILARQGQLAKSQAMLDYSERMSRRDLPTQLWAIELAVQRNDIVGALAHYDKALRVGRAMPPILFPVLAAASEDPNISRPLAALLAKGTPWKDSFLDYLSAQTQNVRAASQLVDNIYRAGGTVGRGPVSIIVQRLSEIGDTTAAWQVYKRENRGEDRLGVRNGSFNAAPSLPTVFDWRVEDIGDARAEIVKGLGGGELHFEARVGAGGAVASQRLLLPAGHYTLSLSARAAEGGSLGGSKIIVECVPSRRVVSDVRLTDAVRTRLVIPLSIPAGCESQSLVLTAQSTSMDTGVDGAIDDVTVQATRLSAALH